MQRQLNAWAVRVLLLAAVPVMAGAINGCASSSTDTEGAYSDPPGFAPQQTAKAVQHGFVFGRDEKQQIVTASVLARRAARQAAKQDENAKSSSPMDDYRIEATFHGTYADGMTVAVSRQPNAYLRVVPNGAKAAKARVRGDGALVAYEGAFPKVTSAFGGTERRVEEFLSIPTEQDVPTLSYRLEPGPDFDHIEQADNTLWAFSKDGTGLFTIKPPVADDSAGKRVTGSWKLEHTSTGYSITADIDLKGLAYPVLLDPTFETPEWWISSAGSPPSGRAAPAAAYALDQNCTVVFGGVSTSVNSNLADTNVRCSVDQRWAANIATSGTTPTARSYSAAAWGGDGTYVFGGYSDLGVSADFYKLNLGAGCATSSAGCTGTWTQIPVSGSWPPPRYMHGMAWTGSSLIIWGGVSGSGTGYRDVWSWNGSSWTQLCDNCFGGGFGLYGFAYGSIVSGTGRRVFAHGGYDNPLGGGAYTNTLYEFNGTGFDVVTVDPENIPLTQNGGLDPSAAPVLEPSPRMLHWMAGTNNGNLILGSGMQGAQGTDAPPDTTWMFIARQPNFNDQWLRPPASLATAPSPGTRESAVAVYDESRQYTVLFGGIDATQTPISSGAPRVYKGLGRQFTLTQSCADVDGDGLCDGSAMTLTVTYADTTACTSQQALFVYRDAATGGWATFPGAVNATLTNGVCSASKTVTWDPTTQGDVGVRVRDLRMASAAVVGSLCTGASHEVANGNNPFCLATGAYSGSASCGGLVDPSIPILSLDCEFY